MESDNLVIDHMPFPYFILDRQLNIVQKSSQARHILAHTDSFINLVDFPYQQETASFLKNHAEEACIEVPLNGTKEQKKFYQIYKSIDENSFLHIYCIPIRTEIANIKEMINKVERKLFKFNQDLMKKKDYLEKTVEEMKDAAQAVDHHHNIETLAAGIAHEIRNPLTTVKGFLQLLKPYLRELGKEQYADVALEEINRANDIIYEFLNAAKPQSDFIQEISLNKLVHDIVILYESEAILRNIQIITSLSASDISIHIPSNQLKQVLINILKNAMEAIDENLDQNRLIIVSTEISEKAFIRITDSGCGMTKDVLNKLFIPFFSTKEKGTGIGLSVCKKIIEENGGSLHVKSEQGHGTTFTISLPIQISPCAAVGSPANKS